MTKLTLREYEVADFMAIALSPVEAENQIGQPIRDWGEYHKKQKMGVTVLAPDGRILFCVGAHHMWGHVAELWAIYSPSAAIFPETLRVTKRLIDVLHSYWGYHRLHATVDPRFEETVRFIEHLGFKAEATLKRYGPHGEDRVMYARLEEDHAG